MRRLKVDLGELALALEDQASEATWYLDTETGALLHVTDEVQRELEAIGEEIYDEAGEEQTPFAEALARRNLPEWMAESITEAEPIEAGLGTRYVRVEPEDRHAGYQDMEDFIETVSDERLQARLWGAIRGRGAFRRFKDTVYDEPAERARWFAFKDARERERAIAWLRDEGIEPVLE